MVFLKLNAVEDSSIPMTSSRLILPHSALESALAESLLQDGEPLMFSITCPSTAAKAFIGVSEFSSEEGTTRLSKCVADSLGLPDAAQKDVVLRNVQLPHATKLVLKPLSGTFLEDVADPAALLTATLPVDHVCVFEGQILGVYAEGQVHQLLVAQVLPKNPHMAVQVINTNVHVEFDNSEHVNPANARQEPVLTPVAASVAVEVPASTTPVRLLAVIPVALLSDASLVLVSDSPSSLDMDMYAALAPMRRPSLVRHHWACAGSAGTTLHLSLHPMARTWKEDALPLHSEGTVTVYITLQRHGSGAEAVRSCTVELRLTAEQGASTSTVVADPLHAGQPFVAKATAAPTEDAAAGKICTNCHALVPPAAYAMHSAVCARNNVRCGHPGCGALLQKSKAGSEHVHCAVDSCGRVFTASALPVHTRIWHTPLPCPFGCSISASLEPIHAHTTRACTNRPVQCRFCGDIVRAGGVVNDTADRLRGLNAHESVCGSKTRVCTLCTPVKGVTRKGWDDHLVLHHAEVLAAHMGTSSSSSDAGWTVLPAAGIDLPSRSWSCPTCTLVQPLVRSGCEACGTHRPLLLKDCPPEAEPWKPRRKGRGSSVAGTPIPSSMGGVGTDSAPGGGTSGGAGEDMMEELELGAASSPRLDKYPMSDGPTGRSSRGADGSGGYMEAGWPSPWGGGHSSTGVGAGGGIRAQAGPRTVHRACANAACGQRVHATGALASAGAPLGLCASCSTLPCFVPLVEECGSHMEEEEEEGEEDRAQYGGAGQSTYAEVLSGLLEELSQPSVQRSGAVSSFLALLRSAYTRQVTGGCASASTLSGAVASKSCNNPACAAGARYAPHTVRSTWGDTGSVPLVAAVDGGLGSAAEGVAACMQPIVEALVKEGREGLETLLVQALAGAGPGGAAVRPFHVCVAKGQELSPAALTCLSSDLLASVRAAYQASSTPGPVAGGNQGTGWGTAAPSTGWGGLPAPATAPSPVFGAVKKPPVGITTAKSAASRISKANF